jgi:recombination protein RecA
VAVLKKGYDQEKLADTLRKLNKKYGAGFVYQLGTKYENAVIERISTSLPDFDSIIGGGLPVGRIIEIYGKESAGKTSLLYHLCSLFRIRGFVNMEGSFDPERARLFGNAVNQKGFILSRPEWGEQAWEILFGLVDSGVPFIGLDSVPAMVPKSAWENVEIGKKDKPNIVQMGAVAKMMSERLPILAAKAEKTGSIIVFVNQVRDNIGVLWGDTETTPGGRALKHYASLRIQVARKGTVVKKGKEVGIISAIRVRKSKVCSPGGRAELELRFDTGYANKV